MDEQLKNRWIVEAYGTLDRLMAEAKDFGAFLKEAVRLHEQRTGKSVEFYLLFGVLSKSNKKQVYSELVRSDQHPAIEMGEKNGMETSFVRTDRYGDIWLLTEDPYYSEVVEARIYLIEEGKTPNVDLKSGKVHQQLLQHGVPLRADAVPGFFTGDESEVGQYW